ENIARALEKAKKDLLLKETEFFNEKIFKDFSLIRLPEIAERHSVKINLISYFPETSKGNNVFNIPAKITLETNYQNLANFIYDLENYKRIIRISGLDIKRKSLNPIVLQVGLSLNAYALGKNEKTK
ncbi:type 4a pilus biogenesis protein PilO, partial [Candidatus Margulisiibacteriota bacterium]